MALTKITDKQVMYKQGAALATQGLSPWKIE